MFFQSRIFNSNPYILSIVLTPTSIYIFAFMFYAELLKCLKIK